MHHRDCNPEINMDQTGEKLQDPHPLIRTLLRLKLSLSNVFVLANASSCLFGPR
jgi:hypothetical protein